MAAFHVVSFLNIPTECYGVPYIPEGQWLCRKCKLSPAQPVDCALCPESFGAFKQTAAGVWVHVLCVLWVPGCVVDNLGTMEPCHITDIDPKRWKLKCCICGRSGKDVGACIQCRKSSCSLAYHVSCARKWKLLLPMKGGNELISYCHLHLPVSSLVRLYNPLSLCYRQSIGRRIFKPERPQRQNLRIRWPILPKWREHMERNTSHHLQLCPGSSWRG